MLKLLRLKKTYYKYSDELYQIYRHAYKKSFISELNNIYVALTRPSHELYAYIPKKIGRSYNIANILTPKELHQCGQKFKYPQAHTKEEKNLMFLDGTSHHNWIAYLNDEHLASQYVDNYHVRLQGTITHFILSKIGNLYGQSHDKIIAYAIEQACREFMQIDSEQSLKARITSILCESTFEDFFIIENGQVYTEKEVVNRYGHTKRIDRLIVREKEIWIVDYKSSETVKDGAIKQIKEYKELIKSLYPKYVVRGFVLYLNELKFKEISG